MRKSKQFDLSAISIIACDCLQAVICIFIDLFFISKVLRLDMADGAVDQIQLAHNIVSIGMFYAVEYFVITLCYSWTGYFLKKINKSIFVSIGSCLLATVVLLVYFLQNNIVTFIPLIAAVYGFAWGFFSSGYHNLTSEVISSKIQTKFFAVKKIMFQLVYIIFPICLGYIADIDFSFVTYIMFVIAALLIVFSFLIRPKKTYKLEFKLLSFSKKLIKEKKELQPLWWVYIQAFFRGASYDCFTTLITILVITNVGSNSALGMYQSIFTALSLITMGFYLKFYRKKRSKWFIGGTIGLVTCTIIGILSVTNEITIIIFYAVYVILNVILMSVSDSRRSGVVRVLSLHSHILESTALTEFWLGAGRILSSVLLLLSGVFDGMLGGGTLFLKIVIGIVCAFYCMYGLSLIFLEKSLIKQDEEFKKAHMAEVIEKVED